METSNQSNQVQMVEFKEGDVVQLKSGGPLMTLKAVTSPSRQYFFASYADNKGRIHHCEVKATTLQHATTWQYSPLTAPPLQTFPPIPYTPLNPPVILPAGPYWGGTTCEATGNTAKDLGQVRCINASSQADGCSDPGDVHQ